MAAIWGNAGDADLIAHHRAAGSANRGIVEMVQPLRELARMGRAGSVNGAEVLGRQVASEFERVTGFRREKFSAACG